MAYSELVKDINKTRSFIRDFYVFGFYSRDEYADLYQISPRSYDNERRRIESWLHEYLRFYQNSTGKKSFLSVDGSTILHNPIYRAFKAKSFTANDALLHFCLMDLFADGQMIGPSQIEDLLWDEYSDLFAEKGLPDMKTIRLKLEDLTRLGLLVKTKEKRSTRYQIISTEIDQVFSSADADEALPGLWDALSFFSENAPLGVIGSFLLDKNNNNEALLQPFHFRHHYLMQAIDSEILCELLLAIDDKRRIQIRVDSAFQGSMQYMNIPLKVFVSTANGREYLLSVNEETKRFYFTRLDRIVWVKQMDISPSWDQMLEQFHLVQHQLWGVSFGGLEEVRPPVHLEMEIAVRESEDFIINRLEREKRNGTVIRLEHVSSNISGLNQDSKRSSSALNDTIDRYLFSVDVYDPLEMLPWICTFTGRILRLDCDDDKVLQKYQDYLTCMEGFYSGKANSYESSVHISGPGSLSAKENITLTSQSSRFRPLLKSGTDLQKPSESGSSGSSNGRQSLIFHEVYGAYYNALARILAFSVRGELTPGKLYDIVQDKAFGESCMYLPDRLLSGEWGFLNENLETCLLSEPTMPLTLIQKRWLKALLQDPKIWLFVNDETYNILSEQLKDIRPLYKTDTFCWFDRFTDGDPFHDPAYIQHFKTVLSAIHQKKVLSVLYQNRFGDTQERRVIPQYVEYSGREDKFRLYAQPAVVSEWQEPLRMNIGRFLDCKILDENISCVPNTKVQKENVILELVDDENTLERAMFHFSFLEKKTERLDNRKFRITLYYPKADETEMVIRILSFGHQLNVISDGYIRKELIARLNTQNYIFSKQTLQ